MQKIADWVIAWLKVNWASVIVWLVLFAILAVVGWVLWKRYGEILLRWLVSVWARITRVPELPVDALTRIWRKFRSEIPLRLRGVVSQYPVFLVLGDSRSGKSWMIEHCGHLDVQDLRYHGRSIDDALLQVYLGNNDIILELSSSFLFATGRDHADALLALWSKLPADTTLVLTLDARGLVSQDAEEQYRIINGLISKVALFTEVSARAIRVRIALTHMDQIRGFPQFYTFAANSGLDMHVALEPAVKLPGFAEGLDHYFYYVNNLLLSLSSSDFIEAMEFLTEVRVILSSLHRRLSEAVDRHELERLSIDGICLISDNTRELQLGMYSNDPFRVTNAHLGFFDGLSKRHTRWVSWIAGIASLVMISNYLVERTAIESAAELVAKLPGISAEQYAAQAHPYLTRLQEDQYRPGANRFWHVGARFYPKEANAVGKALAGAIRTQYLLPGLKLSQLQTDVFQKTVRWLALLHANGANQLGNFFTDPAIDTGISLPIEIRNDYVTWNMDLNDPELLALGNEDFGIQKGRDIDDRPWVRLNELLEFASRDTYLTQSELNEIQNSARDMQLTITGSRSYPELDEQIQWLIQYGHISPNTRELWMDSPTNAVLQSAGLRDVVSLIVSSQVERFEKPQNFIQLLELVQKMMTEYQQDIAKNTIGTVGATVDGRFYSFDSNRWLALIHQSQVKELLMDFYRNNFANNGWIFFNSEYQTYRVPLGISTDSSGGLANGAQVDIRLTRDSFEQKVKPAIVLLSKMIGDIPIQNREKQALVDFFVGNLSIYAGNYSDAYWSFFKNISIRINSSEALQSYLRELQRPGSAFVQNLIRVRENVMLDLPSDPNFQPVKDRLSDFQFMQKLMQEQSGSYPQLQRYIALTTSLLDEITPTGGTEAPPVAEKPAADTGLKSMLTPMGRISYDILVGGPASLMYQVEVYLRELSIPVSWQGPFLAPFQRARDLGRQEVNASISHEWNQLWNSQVVPFLGCFPFERQRIGVINDCDPDAFQRVFHPATGSFWLAAKSKFGSLFTINEGRWIPRQEITRNFILPENIQARMDAAVALTQAFWAKDGTPQPLIFRVKPALLPEITVLDRDGKEVPMPSLAFLRGPGSSVLGFNQRREWQEFAFEWWQKSQISAGIEFMSPLEKIKKYASKDVDETRWGLLHLLASGTRTANNQFGWKVVHPEKPEQLLEVSFTFKEDPFLLFNALR